MASRLNFLLPGLGASHSQRAMEEMMTVLENAGGSGRLLLAQLRSQRAPFYYGIVGTCRSSRDVYCRDGYYAVDQPRHGA